MGDLDRGGGINFFQHSFGPRFGQYQKVPWYDKNNSIRMQSYVSTFE